MGRSREERSSEALSKSSGALVRVYLLSLGRETTGGPVPPWEELGEHLLGEMGQPAQTHSEAMQGKRACEQREDRVHTVSHDNDTRLRWREGNREYWGLWHLGQLGLDCRLLLVSAQRECRPRTATLGLFGFSLLPAPPLATMASWGCESTTCAPAGKAGLVGNLTHCACGVLSKQAKLRRRRSSKKLPRVVTWFTQDPLLGLQPSRHHDDHSPPFRDHRESRPPL